MSDTPTCPKCLRPFNEGNSPNAEECNGTDDDEGLCEAYAKVAEMRSVAIDLYAMAINHCRQNGWSKHPTIDEAHALLFKP